MDIGSSSEKCSCDGSEPDSLCHRCYAPLRSKNRASQTLQNIRTARVPKAFPIRFWGNPFDGERRKSGAKVELISPRQVAAMPRETITRAELVLRSRSRLSQLSLAKLGNDRVGRIGTCLTQAESLRHRIEII